MGKERFVFCQYCDDVRQEVEGKTTLVGIYPGGMQINQPLPAEIPSLVISCSVWTPKSKPFKKLAFRIMMGDTQVMSTDVPIENFPIEDGTTGTLDAGTMLNFQVAMKNVPVVGPTRMNVIVTSEEGEMSGTPMEIRVAAPQE